MSETNAPSLPPSEKPLGWRKIIGLVAPDNDQLARAYGKQYALVTRRAGSRILFHALAAIFTFCLCYGSVPLWIIAVIGVALTASVSYAYALDTRLTGADERSFAVHEIRRHAIGAGIKGLAWGCSIIALAFAGATSLLAELWAVAALLILSGAVSRYSAPLSAICFAVLISLGVFIVALVTSQFVLAVVTVLTALLACFGVIEIARTSLHARMSELAMQEKSETVSMLLREFEDGQADWLWQIDTKRKLRSVSPRLAYALGQEISAVEGQSLLQLISGSAWKTGQFAASLRDLADRLKGRESFSNLVVKAFVQGEVRWWEMSGTPIFDEDGKWQGFRGVGSDVTAQRESSEKIAYLARYDTLTQLPNRLQINESLAESLDLARKHRTRCALLMIDLDRFKAINDSLGHLVGDRMLGQVASRLAPLMGEGELCGRLGGDEFAVIIRDARDRSRPEKLARAIISALSAPYYLDNHILYVGASVGSAIGPRDGDTVEEILRNADLALYRAKDEGGGTHCEYEPLLHSNAEERRVLEVSLRHALERDEFVLHYQPVVDAETEAVVSFEALLRWNSPEHGFVSPVKFIPIAEDTRLIVPIGTWVMQEACREAATNWPAHVKVNINVSPEQLVEPDFAGTVVRALSHSGLDPRRLEIEVTESIFMRDADVARKALEQCMALGCSVALDDFGTGYSSLGYLRKLRFTTIKVDRSFVQGAAQDSPESLAIIRAVVAMADSLGMTTTAEGVENEDEAEMIRKLGCHKIQGYHFGRPMPAEDARKVLRRHEIPKRKRA